jgi:hypothetical protein
MSEILNTAMRLYGFVEQQRDRARQEIEFAHKLKGMELQEKQWGMEALELEFQRENWDETKKARALEIENKIGFEEMKRTRLFVEKSKAWDEALRSSQNDPAMIAWVQEQANAERAQFTGFVGQAVSFVTDATATPEQRQRYMDRYYEQLDSNKDLTATERQAIKGTIFSAVMANDPRKVGELASWNIQPHQMAKAVTKISDIPEGEVLELQGGQLERAKTLATRSQQEFDKLADEEGLSIREKVVVAMQAALADTEGESDPLRMAYAHEVAAGMEQYVNGLKVKAVSKHDGKFAERLGNAGLDLAEKGINFATLAPEEILSAVSFWDTTEANNWIMDMGNSGQTTVNVRDELASRMGGDLLQLARVGAIDPTSVEFKKTAMLATLDTVVRQAAQQPGADAVSLQAATDRIKSQIQNGTMRGAGAMWDMLDTVVGKIQQSVRVVGQRANIVTASVKRRADARAMEGQETLVVPGETDKGNERVIPTDMSGAQELIENMNEKYYLPRADMKTLGNKAYPDAISMMFDAVSPTALTVMGNPSAQFANIRKNLNTIAQRKGNFQDPVVQRMDEFYALLENDDLDAGERGGFITKLWGKRRDELTDEERRNVSPVRASAGRWKKITKGMDKDQIERLQNALQDMNENQTNFPEASDLEMKRYHAIQWHNAYIRAMQAAGIDFQMIGSRDMGYKPVSQMVGQPMAGGE